jgi:acyl-coenzyme A thioesterase PaaI-like protein
MFKTRQISQSHDQCLLCGTGNPWGLKLKFRLHENGSVYSEFQGSRILQGYSGILHGGVISALLDSAMTHCLFEQKIEAVTGDMRVRFRKPVPYQANLMLQARIIENNPPLYKVKAKLLCNNKTMAWSEARFMERNYKIS